MELEIPLTLLFHKKSEGIDQHFRIQKRVHLNFKLLCIDSTLNDICDSIFLIFEGLSMIILAIISYIFVDFIEITMLYALSLHYFLYLFEEPWNTVTF